MSILPTKVLSDEITDLPSKVARIQQLKGEVEFQPASLKQWFHPVVNRPLTIGDKLWIKEGADAKLQISGASLCLGPQTYFKILNLEDHFAQFELKKGTMIFKINEVELKQEYEIDTPNFALTIKKPGYYRVEVNPEENWSIIDVVEGQAVTLGEKASFQIGAKKSYRFSGTQLTDYEEMPSKKDPKIGDEFDKWCKKEEGPEPKMKHSSRYVSRTVIGFEDLDSYGEWKETDDYGHVWVPSKVAEDWMPFYHGKWSWIDPFGWTWIDDAPWGFAPYHYGRWLNVTGKWVWKPGPMEVPAVYSPATVQFIMLENQVAWFPLGPKEFYLPGYDASKAYFISNNISNTKLSSANLAQLYQKPLSSQKYSNLEVPNSIVAMSKNEFADGVAVNTVAKVLSADAVMGKDGVIQGKFSSYPSVVPTAKSIANGEASHSGGDQTAGDQTSGDKTSNNENPSDKLSDNTLDKPSDKSSEIPQFDDVTVLARKKPASEPLSFEAERKELQNLNGKPLSLDEAKKMQSQSQSKAKQVDRGIKLLNALPAAMPEKKAGNPSKMTRHESHKGSQKGDKEKEKDKYRDMNNRDVNRGMERNRDIRRQDGNRDPRYRDERYYNGGGGNRQYNRNERYRQNNRYYDDDRGYDMNRRDGVYYD